MGTYQYCKCGIWLLFNIGKILRKRGKIRAGLKRSMVIVTARAMEQEWVKKAMQFLVVVAVGSITIQASASIVIMANLPFSSGIVFLLYLWQAEALLEQGGEGCQQRQKMHLFLFHGSYNWPFLGQHYRAPVLPFTDHWTINPLIPVEAIPDLSHKIYNSARPN